MTLCEHKRLSYDPFTGAILCQECREVIVGVAVTYDGYHYTCYEDEASLDGYEVLSTDDIANMESWQPVVRVSDQWLHPDYLEMT